MLTLQEFANKNDLLKSLNLVGNKHKNSSIRFIFPYLYYDKFLCSLVKGSLNYNLVQPIRFNLLEFPGQSGSVHQDPLLSLVVSSPPFPKRGQSCSHSYL